MDPVAEIRIIDELHKLDTDKPLLNPTPDFLEEMLGLAENEIRAITKLAMKLADEVEVLRAFVQSLQEVRH